MDVGTTALSNVDVATMTLTGLITFGTVWALSLFVKMDSKIKFLVSIVVALVAGFIPVELGNDILNRVRDAYAVAATVAGGYQAVSRIAEKI